MSGPLKGTKVVHFASLGPGPYAAMLLADLGCEVTIIDRVGPMQVSVPQGQDPRRRGQRSIALDLKQAQARSLAMKLIETADVLIEGMRPGVAERLGFGPAQCQELNPRLVYARVTGWGQDGPLAQRAGHDINYIALSGALHAMGEADRPPPVPLNLLGDYAGGGAFVAMGVLAALIERARTGRGQVIDGAIVDGVASLTAACMGMLAAGRWGERGTNAFDGSMPWYRTYRTRDGGHVAVGAIEPQFYDELLRGLGLDPGQWSRDDRARWPGIEAKFTQVFASQDRAHWQQVFEQTDACVSPVLSFQEAAKHPHHQARAAYVSVDGVAQPAPAPRMSNAPVDVPGKPPEKGEQTAAVLRELGCSDSEIEKMIALGVAA